MAQNSATNFLTRAQVADELSARGFPIKRATLATLVTRGGGPPYRRFGARAIYNLAECIQWAEGKLSPVRNSTSEMDAA